MQASYPKLSNIRRPVDPSLYRNPDNDPRGPYRLTTVTSSFYRPSLQYEWNGQLPPAGRSWRYSRERAAELEAEGRIAFTPVGKPWLKRYLSEAVGEEGLEPLPATVSKLELIVRATMRALAIAVAENAACLRDVEWRDLERVLREVFEGLGFAAELTRPGKDGGFDLKLGCREHGKQRTFLVEVKHWIGSRKKPGRSVLKSLVDVVARTAGATGLLLSSTGFTTSVVSGRTEIEQRKVRLGGEAKIVSLCRSYMQSTQGVWAPTAGLADMLLAGTQ